MSWATPFLLRVRSHDADAAFARYGKDFPLQGFSLSTRLAESGSDDHGRWYPGFGAFTKGVRDPFFGDNDDGEIDRSWYFAEVLIYGPAEPCSTLGIYGIQVSFETSLYDVMENVESPFGGICRGADKHDSPRLKQGCVK